MTPRPSGVAYALRILAGVAGIALLFFSAIVTLGSSLAAPFGIFLGRRLALRKGRPYTGWRSWLAAAAASSLALLLTLLIIVSLIPKEEWQLIQQAIAVAQTEQSKQSPAEISKTFEPDPVTEKVVQSPAFVIVFGAIGLGIGCILFGSIAGTPGWIATLLLSYAIRGRSAPDRQGLSADASSTWRP